MRWAASRAFSHWSAASTRSLLPLTTKTSGSPRSPPHARSRDGARENHRRRSKPLSRSSRWCGWRRRQCRARPPSLRSRRCGRSTRSHRSGCVQQRIADDRLAALVAVPRGAPPRALHLPAHQLERADEVGPGTPPCTCIMRNAAARIRATRRGRRRRTRRGAPRACLRIARAGACAAARRRGRRRRLRPCAQDPKTSALSVSGDRPRWPPASSLLASGSRRRLRWCSDDRRLLPRRALPRPAALARGRRPRVCDAARLVPDVRGRRARAGRGLRTTASTRRAARRRESSA